MSNSIRSSSTRRRTRRPVVLVMQHGAGLDEWQRALAVQVAEDGFIAVAPDLWSGTGPDGGNWDASEFIDDAMRAAAGRSRRPNRCAATRRRGIRLEAAAGEWKVRIGGLLRRRRQQLQVCRRNTGAQCLGGVLWRAAARGGDGEDQRTSPRVLWRKRRPRHGDRRADATGHDTTRQAVTRRSCIRRPPTHSSCFRISARTTARLPTHGRERSSSFAGTSIRRAHFHGRCARKAIHE